MDNEERLAALRDYAKRSSVCVSALAGVEEPITFMQDLRLWRKALNRYQNKQTTETLRNLAALDVIVDEHLKGGDK